MLIRESRHYKDTINPPYGFDDGGDVIVPMGAASDSAIEAHMLLLIREWAHRQGIDIHGKDDAVVLDALRHGLLQSLGSTT